MRAWWTGDDIGQSVRTPCARERKSTAIDFIVKAPSKQPRGYKGADGHSGLLPPTRFDSAMPHKG